MIYNTVMVERHGVTAQLMKVIIVKVLSMVAANINMQMAHFMMVSGKIIKLMASELTNGKIVNHIRVSGRMATCQDKVLSLGQMDVSMKENIY